MNNRTIIVILLICSLAFGGFLPAKAQTAIDLNQQLISTLLRLIELLQKQVQLLQQQLALQQEVTSKPNGILPQPMLPQVPLPVPTPSPAPPPTLSISISSSSVALSWSSANTTSCDLTGPLESFSRTQTVQTSGSMEVSAGTYNITCSGPGGDISKSATVNQSIVPLTPQEPICPRGGGLCAFP